MFMLADSVCAGDGWAQILNFVGKAFSLIQIFIPIGLIILGSIDLGKAVMSSDEKAIKESQGMLFKRIGAAVAVFFVAAIVSIVMNMIGNNAYKDCWNVITGGSKTSMIIEQQPAISQNL